MQSPVVKTILSFVGIPLALFGPLMGAYMTYWMHNLGPVTPKKNWKLAFGEFPAPWRTCRPKTPRLP